MFTVCPKCTLTLAVTTADLRVGQGYVRCGRCSSVFNALGALHDERLPEDPTRSTAAATATRPALVEAQPAATEPKPPLESSPEPSPSPSPPEQIDEVDEIDIILDDDTAAATAVNIEFPGAAASSAPVTPREDLEFDLTRNDLAQIFIEPTADEPTGTFETIVLEGDGMPPIEDALPESTRAQETQRTNSAFDMQELEEIASRARDAVAPSSSETTQLPALPVDSARANAAGTTRANAAGTTRAKTTGAARADMADSTRAHAAGAVSPQAAEAAAAAVASLRARERDAREPALIDREPRGRVIAWMAGCVALALLLVAQLVHHYRDDLAASPALHAPMTAIYSALGSPLTPRWTLGAYDVRQLGAESSPDSRGELIVRASIGNAADHAQPVPLLRLTLQDRYGKRLASRDLEPREYVSDEVARKLLAPGQRIDAAIAVVDPGTDAVGFEIDACLRRGAGIACAADEPQTGAAGRP